MTGHRLRLTAPLWASLTSVETAGSGLSAARALGAGSRVRCSIGSPCRTPPGTSPPAIRGRRPPYIIHNDRLAPGEEPERPSTRGWDDPPAGGARFVAVVRDALTGAVVRTLPRPIYALSRDGRQAVTLNFARLQHQRPGYGYPGVPDPWRDVPEPEDDGIYWLDVETGEHRLVLSLAQVANLERGANFDGAVHRFKTTFSLRPTTGGSCSCTVGRPALMPPGTTA